RGYGFAVAALLVAYLVLITMIRRRNSKGEPEKGPVCLWGVYTLSCIFALYTHVLSALAVTFLGIIWLFLSARRGVFDSFAVRGCVAQVCIALAFLPWLFRLAGQVSYVNEANTTWMTPPTF